MALDNFQPEKIAHVPGQDKRVDDVDKARMMASVENNYKGNQGEDPWFSGDAEGVIDTYKEYLHAKEAARPGSFNTTPDLEWLAEHQVTPEYIGRIAEVEAEKFGALHDYEKGLQNKNVQEIKRDIRGFQMAQIRFGLRILQGELLHTDMERGPRGEPVDMNGPVNPSVDRATEAVNLDTERDLTFAKWAAAQEELLSRKEKQQTLH